MAGNRGAEDEVVLDYSDEGNDSTNEVSSNVPVAGKNTGQQAALKNVDSSVAEALCRAFSEGPLGEKIMQAIAQQVALAMSDVAEAKATTSSQTSASVYMADGDRVTNRAMKIGDELVSRFDPDNPEANVTNDARVVGR